MFVPTLEGQCTEEQKKKWLPLAKTMQIIGTCAQTKLGHGSNVQGLETTTFDHQTDEFVIHSPTLTSSKVKRAVMTGEESKRYWWLEEIDMPKESEMEGIEYMGPQIIEMSTL
ncbi:putative acyl-CoA dehydrogenase/oxidase and middle domain superfamily, acyl-coenzyme A oxidase [Helianthus debilis subsp. tardiflorus]